MNIKKAMKALNIKKKSRNLLDYEKAKTWLHYELVNQEDYEKYIKQITDYIGV